jgi:hypothetical protein
MGIKTKFTGFWDKNLAAWDRKTPVNLILRL